MKIIYVAVFCLLSFVCGVQVMLWKFNHLDTSNAAYEHGFQACENQF